MCTILLALKSFFTQFSTIFQLYRGCQLTFNIKSEYPEKPHQSVVKKWEYQLMQYAIICMEGVIMSGMSRGLRNVQLLEECQMISGMCVIMLGMSRGLRMHNYFRNAYNYLQNVTWLEKYVNILGLCKVCMTSINKQELLSLMILRLCKM